jgi:hypothetical protein
MSTEMNGKAIRSVWWPDSGNDLGRHIIANDEVSIEMSATYRGDHDEFWIVEYRAVKGELKEFARHNPRYIETIEWDNDAT